MFKFILITSALSIGGQPDINDSKFVVTDSDQECIQLMGKLQTKAHKEGRKIYTWCEPAKEFKDVIDSE